MGPPRTSIGLDNGDDVVYVSKQLGHSSVRVTLDVCAHLINRKRRVAEATERARDRWRGKFAARTGGEGRRYTYLARPPSALAAAAQGVRGAWTAAASSLWCQGVGSGKEPL